ncbi:P-loop containing nucleoside triphosphate hydrolase protein [Ephemerocybe angulata]|uniref:DNA 3'-5' helicase n=1 Tax=Ephemerocybe angulata TaxID=980116 RepID=A0A8H6HTF8_9AGAR|nr:P-loop containing nucleoside triphosphate hydrolase protein [Tulosesus angulatus]
MPAHLSDPPELSVERVRSLAQKYFNKRPCLWQVKVAQHLYNGKDVVCCMRTGAGKTLSFWLPLLSSIEKRTKKITLVVTPLNLLGKQNQAELEKAMAKGLYRVVIINPELLTSNESEMNNVLKKQEFTSKLMNIIFDEAHCISTWSTFRTAYSRVGMLRYMLPDVPFYVASATLPSPILNDILEILNIQRHRTEFILYSNNRPEIYIGVLEMLSALSSFKDLAFLIPADWKEGDGRRRSSSCSSIAFWTRKALSATYGHDCHLPSHRAFATSMQR